MISPTEARLRGRIAAYSLHAQGKTTTTAARKAFRDRFLDEVDPDHLLPEPERQRRAGHARSAHYTRLALRSVQARRRKAERAGGGGGDA